MAAAIGVRSSDLKRAEACVAAGVDALIVDIAHGHSDHAINMVRELKQRFDVEVIAGNVATAQGVRDLGEAGADAVKVGVGSGSICTTRIVTGFGVPQLTATLDCAEAARALDVPLIADGGIRNGGDLTKSTSSHISHVASPKKLPWSLARNDWMAARLSPRRNDGPWPG